MFVCLFVWGGVFAFNSKILKPRMSVFVPNPLSTASLDDPPEALKGPRALTADFPSTRRQLCHTQEGDRGKLEPVGLLRSGLAARGELVRIRNEAFS